MKRLLPVLCVLAIVFGTSAWIMLPERIGAGVAMFLLGVTGIAGVLYPQRFVGVKESSVLWIPRLTGSAFLAFAGVLAYSLLIR